MAHIQIVLLSTVPCKIIGCTNGCCEGKYVETQTNQTPMCISWSSKWIFINGLCTAKHLAWVKNKMAKWPWIATSRWNYQGHFWLTIEKFKFEPCITHVLRRTVIVSERITYQMQSVHSSVIFLLSIMLGKYRMRLTISWSRRLSRITQTRFFDKFHDHLKSESTTASLYNYLCL